LTIQAANDLPAVDSSSFDPSSCRFKQLSIQAVSIQEFDSAVHSQFVSGNNEQPPDESTHPTASTAYYSRAPQAYACEASAQRQITPQNIGHILENSGF
jgi:hypothetical protein